MELYIQYWIFFLRQQGRPVTLYRYVISKSYLLGIIFEYRILSTVYYFLSTGETCDVVPVHISSFCYKMSFLSTYAVLKNTVF